VAPSRIRLESAGPVPVNIMTILIPHITIWAVLTTVVVLLAIYRRKVNGTVDETLHVLDAEAGAVGMQNDVAKKLAVIDRWGKALTIVAVLYLLAIAGWYLYSVFADPSVKMS
jgi:hypothetical protein